MRTNEVVVITGKLGTTGGVTCSKVLYWRDGSGNEYDASWTGETVRIETSEDNYEYAVCTATGGALTFATRGLDASNSKTSVASNIKEWRPGAVVKLVASASDIPDLDANNTWSGVQTFENNIQFDGTDIAGIIPISLTTTEMNALDMTGIDSAIIYNTTEGENYQYISGNWVAVSGGSTQPNGSETVAGKYEEGTQTQTDSGDATGETGADLVSTPQKIGRSVQKNAWIKGEDAGGDDTYVVTLTPAPTAYVDGMEILLKATTANTGACSVNVNSLGVKSIKTPGGNDPQNGDIPAGKWKRLRYNGTDFAIVDGHQATITEIGSSKMASDATALAGTNETDYINSLQLKNWSGYTVYPEQGTALANLVSLLQSANTARNNTSLTYIKVKEIVATIAGTYTVYFEIKADVSTTAYGRIYVDGVAVGTERSTTSTSYVGYLENITVTEGQLIQLYYKKTGTNGHYAKDFRLYGFIKPVSLTLTVNTD